MKNTMTYNFECHGIYYETLYVKKYFSLVVGMLELVVDYDTKEFLYVNGFYPLIKSIRQPISLPEARRERYFFDYIESEEIIPSVGYTISNVVDTGVDFNNCPQIYDEEKGIIQIGDINCKEFIRINDNIIIGFDIRTSLKCILLCPDEFVNKDSNNRI